MTFHRPPTTHCPKGHEYDRITKGTKPVKWCSTCQKESNKRRAERLAQTSSQASPR